MQETLTFTFAADFVEARKVQDQLIAALRHHGFDNPDSVFGARLSVEEGVILAIKQGNRFDRAKSCTIEAIFSDDSVIISVMDQDGMAHSSFRIHKA